MSASSSALLSLGVSLWWVVGLRIQAAYGIDVLRYTESPVTVAGTSTALESVRQLGYWYFYGSELVFPFTPQSVGYQEHPWLLIAGLRHPDARPRRGDLHAVALPRPARWCSSPSG